MVTQPVPSAGEPAPPLTTTRTIPTDIGHLDFDPTLPCEAVPCVKAAAAAAGVGVLAVRCPVCHHSSRAVICGGCWVWLGGLHLACGLCLAGPYHRDQFARLEPLR